MWCKYRRMWSMILAKYTLPTDVEFGGGEPESPSTADRPESVGIMKNLKNEKLECKTRRRSLPKRVPGSKSFARFKWQVYDESESSACARLASSQMPRHPSQTVNFFLPFPSGLNPHSTGLAGIMEFSSNLFRLLASSCCFQNAKKAE